MKKLTLTIIALILFNGLFAQYKHYNETTKQWKDYPSYEEYVFEESEFIFEGKTTDFKTFKDEKSQKIYTINKINVSKILRGSSKINLGTIEIIQEGATCGITSDGEIIFIGKDHGYRSTINGIYFCMPSYYPSQGTIQCLRTEKDGWVTNPNLYLPPSNSMQVQEIENIDYYTNFGIGKKFNSKQEIYDFLRKQDNIVIPSDNNLPIKKKDASGSLDVKNKENQAKYAERVKNAQQYEEYLQMKILKQSSIKYETKKGANSCKEFFISEYTDGPQKNKVIEIFNPSDSVKSLNGYSIKIFNNGAPTPLDIPLSGNVNPKETYVVTHPQASPQVLSKAHQTDVKMNFDGNDAIVLNKGTSTYIDKIGEIGVNPGVAGWNVPPGASTKAQDLRRKHPIDQGETDWNQGKNQWDAFPQDSLGNIKQHQNSCSAASIEDITFEIANEQVTSSSPQFYEFDIMVSGSSSNTYIDNTAFVIEYNTIPFGSNIVANNKVTITRGANYNTSTYEDPMLGMTDDAANAIRFHVGTDFNASSWNRPLLTPAQQQLAHIKIEIQNCTGTTDLQFIDIAGVSFVDLYTISPTIDPMIAPFTQYDNANYTQPFNNFTLCPPPTITNFTSPVYPGTWYQGTPTSEYLLTIQGNGFGATRGNGNVYFKKADDGGQSNIPLEEYDFISWADNEIKIIMPSIIDTLTPIGEFTTPGSGIFYVKTNTGDSVLSTTPIDMPYGIKNAGFPTGIKKVRMDLANVNNSDSIAITFLLDTSITNNPMIETIVRRAVADWKCETLVYFETGGSTTLTSAPDGISVIHFTNSLSSGTLAETNMYPATVIQCLDNNGNKHVFPKEIDIAFLRNPTEPWYFDTVGTLPAGMRDFYEVALHEVGHGNLLQHVNAPTVAGNDDELMFWTGLVGPVVLANRRTIDLEAANGGFDVVEISNSLNINFGTCNAANVGTLLLSPDQSCGGLIGFEELFTNNVEFSLYPNPTKDGFSLDYGLKRNASVQFTFLDYMGRELKRFDLKKESTGQHKLFVETSNLTAGLYFLVANIDGKLQTLKVIKQ